MDILRLPAADKNMVSATVRQWLKAEGDKVAQDETLVKMEAETAFIELSAGASGTLRKIVLPEGNSAFVGQALALVGTPKEKTDAALKQIQDENKAREDAGKEKAKPQAPQPAAPRTGQEATEEKKMAPSKEAAQAAPAGQVTPIVMPQAGQSMEEGTIVKWHVSPGDTISEGQVIFEVETDKATVEVEADHAGRLARIVCPEDETVLVKEPVAYLAENDSDVDAFLGQEGGASTTPAKEAARSAPKSAPTPPAEGPKGEVTPVVMPQAGQSMEEGTIVKWHVSPGDTISEGQVIFEVETDKATVEVEADHAGRIARIVCPEDETVLVKEPVAYLAENDEDVDAYIAQQGGASSAPAAAEAPSTPQAAPQPSAPVTRQTASVDAGGRVKASPAARRMASEQGIDLRAIPEGSGPGGRIISTDLDQAFAAPGEPIRKPLSGMRKAIAKNLQASKQTVPHFYMRQTIDAQPMLDFHKAKKAEFKCSMNDVIIWASSRALREFPGFRTRLEGDELVEMPTANIGIAVGMEKGLVVPVMIGADRMGFKQVASESRRLIEGARGGKIENMGQGVFTISNLGMFGIEEFTAIVNPPEAAILAVSAIREQVIVENGAMRPGKVMTFTLSCDHRVVDGLLAAQFTARFKEILENPESMA